MKTGQNVVPPPPPPLLPAPLLSLPHPSLLPSSPSPTPSSSPTPPSSAVTAKVLAMHAAGTLGKLTIPELKAYLKRAHGVIASALPKRKQAELGL